MSSQAESIVESSPETSVTSASGERKLSSSSSTRLPPSTPAPLPPNTEVTAVAHASAPPPSQASSTASLSPAIYIPSLLTAGAPKESGSFWDIFSGGNVDKNKDKDMLASNGGVITGSFSTTVQMNLPTSALKRNNELLEWCPDLNIIPPNTSLHRDWIVDQENLAERDRICGHNPHALRFGFIDELGEYHPMLPYYTEQTNTQGNMKKKETKYTIRAREAAKDILSSIQHHRSPTMAQYEAVRSAYGLYAAQTQSLNAPSDSSAVSSASPYTDTSSLPSVVIPETMRWTLNNDDGI